jgi:hypothetical protein
MKGGTQQYENDTCLKHIVTRNKHLRVYLHKQQCLACRGAVVVMRVCVCVFKGRSNLETVSALKKHNMGTQKLITMLWEGKHNTKNAYCS